MVITPELVGFILKKAKIPDAVKVGLLTSYIVFKGFDIEGRVKRAMQPKSDA